MGDEGSAYCVARKGLEAAARALDGRGPETTLADALFEAIGAKDRSGMVQAVYGRQSDRRWLASLAKVVVATADAGDLVAVAIMNEAATELARLCRAVADQLGDGQSHGHLPIVLAGGLLVHSPFWRDRLVEELQRVELGRAGAEVVKRPVLGAIKLAQRVEPPQSS